MIDTTTLDSSRGVRTPSLVQIAEIAFREGLAAALRSVPPGRELLPRSAFGRTLVPAGDMGSKPQTASPETLSFPARIAALEGLTLVRAKPTPATAHTRSAELPLVLIALRVGLTRRTLGLAIEHLRGRMSEGRPLIQRQLVQGNVAEVAAALAICSQAITASAAARQGGGDATESTQPTEWMHDRLDRADSLVVAMFGAAGFLLDHPARCLHVVALLRDLWDPGGQGDPTW